MGARAMDELSRHLHKGNVVTVITFRSVYCAVFLNMLVVSFRIITVGNVLGNMNLDGHGEIVTMNSAYLQVIF